MEEERISVRSLWEPVTWMETDGFTKPDRGPQVQKYVQQLSLSYLPPKLCGSAVDTSSGAKCKPQARRLKTSKQKSISQNAMMLLYLTHCTIRAFASYVLRHLIHVVNPYSSSFKVGLPSNGCLAPIRNNSCCPSSSFRLPLNQFSTSAFRFTFPVVTHLNSSA